MIGIIVAGHGNFGTGLTSGLKLLAGETEFYEAVDFEAEDSIDMLTDKLTAAIGKLEGCESIAIFTDLTGGSPFNVASRLKMADKEERIQVAGGTSLPVVLQAYMSRMGIGDAIELVDSSLEAGKGQMVRLTQESGNSDDCDCECEEYEE